MLQEPVKLRRRLPTLNFFKKLRLNCSYFVLNYCRRFRPISTSFGFRISAFGCELVVLYSHPNVHKSYSSAHTEIDAFGCFALLERSHANQKLPHEISQSRLELSSFHTAGPDDVSDNSSVTTKIVI